MAIRLSNIFTITVLNAATGAFTTDIPGQSLYEGTSAMVVDLSTYWTEGTPVSTAATVALYTDLAGTQALTSSDLLAMITSIVWNTSTKQLTINVTGVNVPTNRTIYAQVSVTQPDP